MKEIDEVKGRGQSARAIDRESGLARNTVSRYLGSPEAIRPQPRQLWRKKPDAYTGHIARRLSEGLENCRALSREIHAEVFTPSQPA